MYTYDDRYTNLLCITCKHEWTIEGTTVTKSIQCPICNSLHWSHKATKPKYKPKKWAMN